MTFWNKQKTILAELLEILRPNLIERERYEKKRKHDLAVKQFDKIIGLLQKQVNKGYYSITIKIIDDKTVEYLKQAGFEVENSELYQGMFEFAYKTTISIPEHLIEGIRRDHIKELKAKYNFNY